MSDGDLGPVPERPAEELAPQHPAPHAYGPPAAHRYSAPPAQPWPMPPANPYGPHLPAAPTHDRAGFALGLGLTSLIGAFLSFGITLLGAPFAWAIGRRSLREIRASHGRVAGEGMAMTGMVAGIIGTVLLAIAVVLLVVFAIVVVADANNHG